MNETEIEKLVVRIVGDTSGYTKSLKEASDATQISADRIQIASNRVSAFGLKVRGFGAEAATALLPLVGITSSLGIAFKAVNLAAEAEKTQAAFGVMLQSVEKGVALTKNLQQFAAETPLNTGDIQRATKLLLQFGVSADDVIPTLRQLGDVTGGDAQRLMQMALAFGQASASGRLMGQDLLQMINAGFNPLQEMSRKTGKSVIELKQQMEKGQISIQMVRDAFKSATGAGGQFQNNMQTASKTLSGLFSTMQDDIDSVLRTIGTDLVDALQLKEAVKGVSSAAQTIGAWFNGLNQGSKVLLGTLVTTTGALVVLSATWTLLGPIMIGTVRNLGQVIAAATGAAAAIGRLTATVAANAISMEGQTVATTSAVAAMRAYTVQSAAAASAGMAEGFVSAATLSKANAEMAKFTTGTLAARAAAVALTASLALLAVGGIVYVADRLTGGTKRVQEMDEAMRQLRNSSLRAAEAQGAALGKSMKRIEDAPEKGRRAALEKEIKAAEQVEKEWIQAQEAITKSTKDMDTTINTVVRNVPLVGRESAHEFDRMKKHVDRTNEGLEAQQKHLADLRRSLQDMGGETAKGVSDPTVVAAIDKVTKKYEDMAATVGMTAGEMDIFRLKQLDLTGTAAQAGMTAAEQAIKVAEQAKTANDAHEATKKLTKSLQDQIATWGMTSTEIAIYERQLAGASGMELDRLRGLDEQLRKNKELQELTEKGNQVTAQFATPQQQFNDRVAELNELLIKNQITQGTYSRALADARKQLDSAERSAAGLNSQLGELSTARFGGSEFRRLMRNQAISMSLRSSSTAGGLASPKAENLLDQISRNTAEALNRVVTIAEANF